MNTEKLKLWLEARVEYEHEYASVDEQEMCKTMLEVLTGYENTQKTLEDLAETNYNLAHQPTNVFGKVILERDALRAENERLKTLLKEATEDAGYELNEQGHKVF